MTISEEIERMHKRAKEAESRADEAVEKLSERLPDAVEMVNRYW